jgi:hypothetical protein
LRDSTEPVWGQTEKIGKGTKANYDPGMKTLTFCFNRGPAMSSELLRKQREQLMKELKDLGYVSRMKYNGEVLVEDVEEANLVLTKKNGKLVIHINNKQAVENKEEKSPSDQNL